MKYSNIFEEEIKNRVSQDFFQKFDCTKILGKIDFAVRPHPQSLSNLEIGERGEDFLLWAEVKPKPTDVVLMLTQLVLTIGKARTFDEILPPPFLGCFDNEKIAFIPYSEIQHIFYQNDFNWKIAPSDSETREFKQVYEQIKTIIYQVVPWRTYVFDFEKDEKELKKFIRDIKGMNPLVTTVKTRIDKNNFITIYCKWLETVKPTIQISDWEAAKKVGIIDCDFYLADLLSLENKTITDKLSVILKSDHYELDKKKNLIGFLEIMQTGFVDNQKNIPSFGQNTNVRL
jgi:hypothetical protein